MLAHTLSRLSGFAEDYNSHRHTPQTESRAFQFAGQVSVSIMLLNMGLSGPPWRHALRLPHTCGDHHSCVKILVNNRYDLPVHVSRQQLYQLLVVDRVEELFQCLSPRSIYSRQLIDFLAFCNVGLRAPSRAEAVACLREFRFVTPAQHLGYWDLLDDAVTRWVCRVGRSCLILVYIYLLRDWR